MDERCLWKFNEYCLIPGDSNAQMDIQVLILSYAVLFFCVIESYYKFNND